MASVELTGLDEILDGLAKADRYLETGIKSFHRLAAGEYYKEALPEVPTASGALKASGRFTGQKRKGRVVFGRKRFPWTRPAHWGWENRPQGGSNPTNRFLIDPRIENAALPRIVVVYEGAATEALRIGRLL